MEVPLSVPPTLRRRSDTRDPRHVDPGLVDRSRSPLSLVTGGHTPQTFLRTEDSYTDQRVFKGLHPLERTQPTGRRPVSEPVGGTDSRG